MRLEQLTSLLDTPHGQFLVGIPIILFSLYQAVFKIHLFWLIVLVVAIYIVYTKIEECKDRSQTRNYKELGLALTGLFIDPQQTYAKTEDNLYLRGRRVGEPFRFQIISMNGNKMRHTKNEEGWKVRITGTSNIIADLDTQEAGILTYNCIMRKAGPYNIYVTFRDRHIKGSPFKLVFKAGKCN